MLGLQQLQDTAELMKEAQYIVALTGAGISTESGIPDFRSPGSIWGQQPPVSYQDFMSKPEARRQYWQIRRNFGSPTGLVMRIVPSNRPLALASPSRDAALISATLSGFQADPILFLITKRVRES